MEELEKRHQQVQDRIRNEVSCAYTIAWALCVAALTMDEHCDKLASNGPVDDFVLVWLFLLLSFI